MEFVIGYLITMFTIWRLFSGHEKKLAVLMADKAANDMMISKLQAQVKKLETWVRENTVAE